MLFVVCPLCLGLFWCLCFSFGCIWLVLWLVVVSLGCLRTLFAGFLIVGFVVLFACCYFATCCFVSCNGLLILVWSCALVLWLW